VINRRSFFTRSALAAGGLAGFPHVARPAEVILARPGQPPARIIHMVADGMSMGTLTAADYLSRHLRQRGLTWLSLYQQPATRYGLMNMRSLNSMVTDSSAASSSWGSGSRVVNGAVNLLPSGRGLTPLYALFGELGWKRGLVTTTEITHATPAGFAASVESRNSAQAIAAQFLDREIEVLLGGGQKFFEARLREDKRDLRRAYAAQGYQVMDTAAALAQAPTDQRWLGIFAASHLPYMVDQLNDAQLRATVPTLSMMTRRALDWLGRHEHFILQVEGGRVDHAAHNCDAPAAMREMLAFDEALDQVLEFQQQRPDTLVVITTDHGNGNLGVNATGSSYNQSTPSFHRVAEVNASFVEIQRRLRHLPPAALSVVAEDEEKETTTKSKKPAPPPYVPSVKEIQAVMLDATGYKVSERRAGWYRAFLEKKGTTVYQAMNSELLQLGQLLANHISVGWAGGDHTADYVPVTAVGPGAERFTGFVQNTDIFRHYTDLAAIDFRNPTEPLTASYTPKPTGAERVTEYALA
jgi:alkaline phosphatase